MTTETCGDALARLDQEREYIMRFEHGQWHAYGLRPGQLLPWMQLDGPYPLGTPAEPDGT